MNGIDMTKRDQLAWLMICLDAALKNQTKPNKQTHRQTDSSLYGSFGVSRVMVAGVLRIEIVWIKIVVQSRTKQNKNQ